VHLPHSLAVITVFSAHISNKIFTDKLLISQPSNIFMTGLLCSRLYFFLRLLVRFRIDSTSLGILRNHIETVLILVLFGPRT
jgi:hypothetical protein